METFPAALVPVVTEIFNKVLDAQEFPKCWKKAIAKVLHKKEPSFDMKNYRPVSSFGAFFLFFETFLYRQIRDRLLKNFDERQHFLGPSILKSFKVRWNFFER